MKLRGLEVVLCDQYLTKLTERQGARRWKLANANSKGTGRAAQEQYTARRNFVRCVDCPDGKGREAKVGGAPLSTETNRSRYLHAKAAAKKKEA